MSKQASWQPLRWSASVSVALQVVAVAVLLMVVGAAYFELRSTRQAIVMDTERQMSRLDMVFAEQTGRAIEAVDLVVSGALESVQARLVRTPDVDDLIAPLDRRISRVRQLSAILVFDANAKQILGSNAQQQFVPQAQVKVMLDRYRANPGAGLLIGEPFRIADDKWNVLLVRPMLGPDGALIGMAAGSINLNYFEEFYHSVELTENGAIILHRRDGIVLARFPHVDKAIGTSFGNLSPFTEVLAHAMSGTLLMKSPVDGSVRVTAIRALRSYPLAVMVSVDQARVLVDWRRDAVALVVIALLLGGAVVLLLLSLARRSRRIEHLLNETHLARARAETSNDRLVQQMSEREKAEGALRQAQRIEAIGQLTGGVAHDFNNLLTVVLGNVEILQRAATSETSRAALAPRLAAIRAAAERGATLTSHLLAFARRQPLMPRPVDLNAAIRGMKDLLDSAVGMRACMNLRLAPDLWPARVDQGQIELLILNLVINARDAIAESGVITVQTLNYCNITSEMPDGLAPGDYVRIIVADNGAGMSPEVLSRVFEPFFTTKAPGAGSGLGLSQVFGTARQSGGEVHIDSKLGHGTTVTVDLPRAAVIQPPIPDIMRAPNYGQPNATVLLVDDDEPVRAVVVAMLHDLGYKVREADTGEVALSMLDPGVDVLLTDLVMPVMSGSQLAARARREQPDLAVLFISGYAEELADTLAAGDRLLRKPFSATELHHAIEGLLSSSRRLSMAETSGSKHGEFC